MTSIIEVSLDYFFRCEQQQTEVRNAHWHALSVINHGDASDSGDIDEWECRSVSEVDDHGDDEYSTTSYDDEPVTHLIHL